MLNSDMVVLWKNDDGSTTVSQRKAVWYSEPLVLKAPKRLADPVEPKLTAVSITFSPSFGLPPAV